MVEPTDTVLVLPRELREDVKGLETRLAGRLDGVDKRLDAMHQNGMRALKSFVGHRVMVERTFASFDDQVQRLEATVAELKAAQR